MSNSKRDISLHIIGQNYGPDAKNLAQAMLSNASCSIAYIKQKTQLENRKLRQLMVIFFKMGLIAEDSEKQNHFKMSESSVLEKTRNLLYVNFMKTRQGDLAAEIARTLLINGVMTYDDCINDTIAFSEMTNSRKTLYFFSLIFL
jgi:hypothetical protein